MNFFRKLAGFWADFSPWLLVHMIVFSLAGGYLGYDFLGEKGAAYYYTVILSADATQDIRSTEPIPSTGEGSTAAFPGKRLRLYVNRS